MNRDQKSATIEQIATEIEQAEAVFAVDYRGLSVPQAAELRDRLRDADARFRVVKNTLTERAADRAGAEALKELLEGPTALTFVSGDAAVAAKAIADYGRAADGLLPFKGGLLGEQVLSVDELRALSRLPARDVMYGQLVGMIASPVSGLVRTLNALIAGLAIQLGQIAERGLVAGEAPVPEPEAEAEPRASKEAEAAASETDDNHAQAPETPAGAEQDKE
jgi:large subunit ribosomal protein L10